MLTSNEKSKQGRKNRASGSAWERFTRDFLIKEGWNISKFQSNVDLVARKLIPAKSNRFLMRSMGFPDFICWRLNTDGGYSVIAVECKINGQLSKDEKEKIDALIELNVFSKVYVCKKDKKGKSVVPIFIDPRTKEWKLSLS